MDQFPQSKAQVSITVESARKSQRLTATRPFQFWWYVWLFMTGLGLGLTVSCKWVGLFTIATIGMSTVKGLWELWGNTRIPKVSWSYKEDLMGPINLNSVCIPASFWCSRRCIDCITRLYLHAHVSNSFPLITKQR